MARDLWCEDSRRILVFGQNRYNRYDPMCGCNVSRRNRNSCGLQALALT